MFFKSTIFGALAIYVGVASPAPSSRADTHIGDVTFFSPGLGACGTTNTDADFVVAVSAEFFDSFGSPNRICGRQITATTTDGKTVTVTVEDRCPGCALDDLDMSPSAFSVLGDLNAGRITGVSWELM